MAYKMADTLSAQAVTLMDLIVAAEVVIIGGFLLYVALWAIAAVLVAVMWVAGAAVGAACWAAERFVPPAPTDAKTLALADFLLAWRP